MNQEGIRNLARKVASNIKKPTDVIRMPYEKVIQVPKKVIRDVTSGIWIFKTTKTETVTEMRDGTKVDYRDYPIEGWILYTFYEFCDAIEGPRSNPYKEKTGSKYFYVLKKDGMLVVYELGFEIQNSGSNYEKLEFWQSLTEYEMSFSLPGSWSDGTPRLPDLVEKHSAYALDYKSVKWNNTNQQGSNGVMYFTRNIPYKEGNSPSLGNSFRIHQDGSGLVKALNKLKNK